LVISWMRRRISLWLAMVISLIGFLAGSVVGWAARDMSKYDACLDRISYDKNRWHLCDTKEPARESR
jgi:hypothetical protein